MRKQCASGFKRACIALFTLAVIAAGPVATAVQVPPEQQELITMMTTGGAPELERAAARASVIPLDVEPLAEVAILHMDGPPPGFRSREFPSGILQAIALAGVVRTPELLARLEAIGASSPAELTARTGQNLVHTREAPACARAHLRGENLGRCDAAAWIPGGRSGRS